MTTVTQMPPPSTLTLARLLRHRRWTPVLLVAADDDLDCPSGSPPRTARDFAVGERGNRLAPTSSAVRDEWFAPVDLDQWTCHERRGIGPTRALGRWLPGRLPRRGVRPAIGSRRILVLLAHPPGDHRTRRHSVCGDSGSPRNREPDKRRAARCCGVSSTSSARSASPRGAVLRGGITCSGSSCGGADGQRRVTDQDKPVRRGTSENSRCRA